MTNYQLSEGTLKLIMNDDKVPDPIMQVLGSKKINSSSSDKERYRILLSDGKNNVSFAMLTTQASSGGVQTNSIIKLKKYITSMINNVNNGERKVLLILDMELIADGNKVGKIIGNPTPLGDDKGSSTTVSNSTSIENSSMNRATTAPAPVERPSSMLNQSLSESRIISPISGLTPYHNKWVIKARVSNKSDMRTWSNSRGEGKLFNIDLIDESGEIRCTAFRDIADKFFNYLQVDKVYYISKCQLKPANKQFSQLNNDYEMTMTNETVIEECLSNDNDVPQVKFNFVPIDEIANRDVGTLVDVIGICKSASDLQTFTSRSTNRELKKRDVHLVDQSKTAIDLTLWGSQAESFDGSNNPVVVVKGAKIGEFGGGKNLSTLMSSQLKINPDIQECYRIKGWYDIEGKQADVKNISERSGIGGGFQTSWMSFKEVQEQGLGQSEKGDYYQTMGTILLIRSENSVYKACPTAECNKKVVDLENGMYRCEKCNREYPNFKYRLLVSMNIGDWSTNQWVSLFASEAENVLGKTSQDVGYAMENDSEGAVNIFQEANFKQFIFKCRAKMETYNDEQRLKTVVVKVDPVNYEEHNSYLVDKIQSFIS
ncbi:replication protein A 70 kDa DNA-binding subunit [Asbolus verrucosus]|uniref:Replication protein A subunit n=1 Tax=Asbolus verrucosus TaxID=1661398 RepID=A0A482VB45_ASBVE|nr:replication protein A 70 kDa DNA-binding subunit [Asbolus verrucosus]